MKQIISYLLIAFLAISCKDKNVKTPEANAAVGISAEEKALLEDTTKYPDSSLVVEALAKFYDSTGNYKAALNTIQTRLQKDSLNPHWLDILGWLYYENDDTTNAISAYEKAVKLYPDPQYVITLGALYAGRKDPNALVMSDALLKSPGANATKEAYFIEGLYYSNTGDKLKAISFFDKCLADSYTFVNAYLEKGNALANLGKYDEAVKVYDKGIAVQNNFPDAYFAKGKALEQLNKKPEAIEAYKMALVYDNQYTDAQTALDNLQK